MPALARHLRRPRPAPAILSAAQSEVRGVREQIGHVADFGCHLSRIDRASYIARVSTNPLCVSLDALAVLTGSTIPSACSKHLAYAAPARGAGSHLS